MHTESSLRQDLVDLFSILSYFGWDDIIYTHASVRVPDSNSFLINPFGLLFEEVTTENLDRFEIDTPGEEKINLAGFYIHNAIYKYRPDVNCVIHLHTTAGIAVGANRQGLLPLSQYANAVLQSLSYHDYHGIVVDANDQEPLLKDLGSTNHMLLRNHGLLTVGINVVHAFFNMYNLQKACEVQVLTNINDCVQISPTVIDSAQSRQIKFNQSHPGGNRPLAWQALLRKIKK
jgi:ribulose-5-phosphate 4-epimerase/fuculose-1-phosphate aldolase